MHIGGSLECSFAYMGMAARKKYDMYAYENAESLLQITYALSSIAKHFDPSFDVTKAHVLRGD